MHPFSRSTLESRGRGNASAPLRRRLAWAAAALIACAAAQAQAPTDGPEDGVPPPWELYDTDKDGYVSAEEAEAQKMPASVFRSLDMDRDGRLNREEFSVAPLLPAE
ncbi:EF-hand domain-containing protein [Nitrosovibrio sp. Nv17]|jgi:hypothetical protein|uniref:EF-hand domain-containing protein n=1 Tax=Nitrosovibrio sp. Nv17 TaxID=1855339 RepID=UPI000908614B|nr:EF-hand domain-containing protein [Nitrosovibrio sp. Nv17]SFW18068.1 EF hand [Nitrosovibrio sp. Nv17]